MNEPMAPLKFLVVTIAIATQLAGHATRAQNPLINALFEVENDVFETLYKFGEAALPTYGGVEESAIRASGEFVAPTQPCLNNTKYQVPLHRFRPKIYYYRVGGPSSGSRVEPLHVFDYGYTDSEMLAAGIDPTKKSKFFTHGITGSFNGASGYLGALDLPSDWMRTAIDLLARSPDTEYNVFVLSWPMQYVTPPIGVAGVVPWLVLAISSTRTVGAYWGDFMARYHHVLGARPDDWHLIGHSLGGQIVGYAGKRVIEQLGERVKRITSLDPVAYCYTTTQDQDVLRLDKNDAQYVEMWVTNVGVISQFSEQGGHRDVWVNDGMFQPGCGLGIICAHARAEQIYVHSSDECQLVAYQCFSWDLFKQGACPDCQADESRCTLVSMPIGTGYDEFDPLVQRLAAVHPTTSELAKKSGPVLYDKYHIRTGHGQSLCLQHYQVSVTSNVLLDEAYLSVDGASFSTVSLHRFNGTYSTGLLTFSGRARPITVAGVRAAAASQEPRVIMQVKFMSNISRDVRQSISTDLCAKPSGSIAEGETINLESC